MRAIAVTTKRRWKQPRVHFVRSGTQIAHCGLRPRHGWQEIARTVNCPRCCAIHLAAINRLPNWNGR